MNARELVEHPVSAIDFCDAISQAGFFADTTRKADTATANNNSIGIIIKMIFWKKKKTSCSLQQKTLALEILKLKDIDRVMEINKKIVQQQRWDKCNDQNWRIISILMAIKVGPRMQSTDCSRNIANKKNGPPQNITMETWAFKRTKKRTS